MLVYLYKPFQVAMYFKLTAHGDARMSEFIIEILFLYKLFMKYI
jgi:hypothetical protein